MNRSIEIQNLKADLALMKRLAREDREEKKEKAKKRSEGEREAAIAVMASRYEFGEDLFTGEPLRGQDATDWQHQKFMQYSQSDDED